MPKKFKTGHIRVLIAVCIAIALVLFYPWYQGQVQANAKESCTRFRQVVLWEFQHSMDAALAAGEEPTKAEMKDLLVQAIGTTDVTGTVEEDGDAILVTGVCRESGTIVFTLTDTAYAAVEASCSAEGHETLYSGGYE